MACELSLHTSEAIVILKTDSHSPFVEESRPETPTMSIVQVDATAPKVAIDEVIDVAAKGGIKLPDQMAADFVTLVSGLEAIIASLPDDSCVIPRPDVSKYPRTGFHVPADNDLGGWAAKVSYSSSSPLAIQSLGRAISNFTRRTDSDIFNANRVQHDAKLPPTTYSKAERLL